MNGMYTDEKAALDGAVAAWERWEAKYAATPSEELNRNRKIAGAAVDRIRARIAKRMKRDAVR